MTHFNQLIAEVATLPFDDQRCEIPAKVLTQAFIGEAIAIEFEPPQQAAWSVNGRRVVDDGVVSDLVRHLTLAFPLVVRDGRCTVRGTDPPAHLTLKRP